MSSLLFLKASTSSRVCITASNSPNTLLWLLCLYLIGTGHYLLPGGTGDLGLNKVKFSRPPFECYFSEVIPPNNIWWPSRSPPHYVFIFQPNLSGPPTESFQSLHWSPLLGSQLRLIPPFVLLKIKWSPPNPPPFLAINNDRSLRLCKPWILQLGKNCITFVFHLSWVF